MKEMFSNIQDCKQLATKLYEKLGTKIAIDVDLQGVADGDYHIFPYSMYSSYEEYRHNQLHLHYLFCRGEFLRIGVENCYFQASVGHKLAALSGLYEALRDEFGEPTVFYTLKDDKEEGLHFQWAFKNKEETIEEFMHGFPFDDDEVNQAITIGEETALNEETRNLFSRQMGLPFELLPLINENIEDYMKYKYGQEKNNENEKSSDGYQKVISKPYEAGK